MEIKHKEFFFNYYFYFVLARLAADRIPFVSERVRSNGFNFDTFEIKKKQIFTLDIYSTLTRTTVTGADSNPSKTIVHVPSSSTSSIVHS